MVACSLPDIDTPADYETFRANAMKFTNWARWKCKLAAIEQEGDMARVRFVIVEDEVVDVHGGDFVVTREDAGWRIRSL